MKYMRHFNPTSSYILYDMHNIKYGIQQDVLSWSCYIYFLHTQYRIHQILTKYIDRNQKWYKTISRVFKARLRFLQLAQLCLRTSSISQIILTTTLRLLRASTLKNSSKSSLEYVSSCLIPLLQSSNRCNNIYTSE